MTGELGAALRDLVASDPRVAVIIGEILGPPVGSQEAMPRLWET